MENSNLIPFEGKEIRKEWHNEQWYFSIIDVIEVLTETNNPSRYWQDLKRKSSKTDGQLYDFIVKLKFMASDGKMRPTECANTQGILRIIMSVPSPKAEPLKLWMAQVGSEFIQEIENPELGFERMKEIYKAKGYPDDWIERRMQTIETRKELTEEWKKRGVQEGREYSILTATIAKGTFGLAPSEHAKLKGLEKENLRDHMTPFELIFTALGEEATKQFAINEAVKGFNENHEAAVKGGSGAGIARKNFEKSTGLKVVSDKNFKHLKSGEKEKLSEGDNI